MERLRGLPHHPGPGRPARPGSVARPVRRRRRRELRAAPEEVRSTPCGLCRPAGRGGRLLGRFEGRRSRIRRGRRRPSVGPVAARVRFESRWGHRSVCARQAPLSVSERFLQTTSEPPAGHIKATFAFAWRCASSVHAGHIGFGRYTTLLGRGFGTWATQFRLPGDTGSGSRLTPESP